MYADLLGMWPTSGQLTYSDMVQLTAENNLSTESDELIICVAWNESNFNYLQDTTGARGLMQVRRPASIDAGVEYDYLFEPSLNIQAGSKYLEIRKRYPGVRGDLKKALQGYGTGSTYPADKILDCEQCLKTCSPNGYQPCLELIHK